jgi:hypothetical protein
MPRFPKTTATWIAACAAHDLTFWSDSPIARTVWATSDDQRWHLVRVNTKDRTAVHACGVERHGHLGIALTNCPGDRDARPYVDPASVAELEGSMLLAAAALIPAPR